MIATGPSVNGRVRTSWTGAELLAAQFPEPRWAIPGLVPEGLTFLAGAPKIGKSWLLLNGACAIASGGRAFGKVRVVAGEVLYLALEDPPRRLQERLRHLLDGRSAPDGLFFETEWSRLSEGGIDRLDRWLTGHPDCRLVIVDVFARVRPRAVDTNSVYEADYEAASSLKALADEHRIGVVGATHIRKAKSDDFLESVSGTFGLAGAADGVLVIARARGSADAVLHVTGRDVEEVDHALRLDGGRWTLLDGPASDYELGDTRRQILEAVREHAGSGPKEIAVVTQLDYENVKKTMRRMVEDDQLYTNGHGAYHAPALDPVPPVPGVPREGGARPRDSRDAGDMFVTERYEP